MNPNIDAMNVSNIKSVSLFGAEQYRLRPLCVVCFVFFGLSNIEA